MVKRVTFIAKRILEFILFSNLYIALCAVLMCQTTARLFKLNLPVSFVIFLFAGTLGSYSLHWFLTDSSADATQRGQWNQIHKNTLLGLFIGTAILGLGLLLYLQPYWFDLLPVIFLTFLYSAPKINWRFFIRLRRIAVLKSVYLALIWTYVTAAIPLLMVTPVQRPGEVLLGAWLINRFLFIYSIAFWFDYRDRTIDRQSKWLTIASMLNETHVLWFFYGIILCFGLTDLGLWEQGLKLGPLACLSLPIILLGLTARRIAAQPSDYTYYIYLDGLLMLSGLLLEFVTI